MDNSDVRVSNLFTSDEHVVQEIQVRQGTLFRDTVASLSKDRSVSTSGGSWLGILNPWDYADILVSCDNLAVCPRTCSGGVRGPPK